MDELENRFFSRLWTLAALIVITFMLCMTFSCNQSENRRQNLLLNGVSAAAIDCAFNMDRTKEMYCSEASKTDHPRRVPVYPFDPEIFLRPTQ